MPAREAVVGVVGVAVVARLVGLLDAVSVLAHLEAVEVGYGVARVVHELRPGRARGLIEAAPPGPHDGGPVRARLETGLGPHPIGVGPNWSAVVLWRAVLGDARGGEQAAAQPRPALRQRHLVGAEVVAVERQVLLPDRIRRRRVRVAIAQPGPPHVAGLEVHLAGRGGGALPGRGGDGPHLCPAPIIRGHEHVARQLARVAALVVVDGVAVVALLEPRAHKAVAAGRVLTSDAPVGVAGVAVVAYLAARNMHDAVAADDRRGAIRVAVLRVHRGVAEFARLQHAVAAHRLAVPRATARVLSAVAGAIPAKGNRHLAVVRAGHRERLRVAGLGPVHEAVATIGRAAIALQIAGTLAHRPRDVVRPVVARFHRG